MLADVEDVIVDEGLLLCLSRLVDERPRNLPSMAVFVFRDCEELDALLFTLHDAGADQARVKVSSLTLDVVRLQRSHLGVMDASRVESFLYASLGRGSFFCDRSLMNLDHQLVNIFRQFGLRCIGSDRLRVLLGDDIGECAMFARYFAANLHVLLQPRHQSGVRSVAALAVHLRLSRKQVVDRCPLRL